MIGVGVAFDGIDGVAFNRNHDSGVPFALAAVMMMIEPGSISEGVLIAKAVVILMPLVFRQWSKQPPVRIRGFTWLSATLACSKLL